jgi:hypothetical protein
VIFFIEPDGNVTISSLSGPTLSIAETLNPDDGTVKTLQKMEVSNVSLYDHNNKTYCG